MKVIKFGGSSVATSSSLKKVFSIIENEKDNIFVVVSALGDITDILQEFLNCIKNVRHIIDFSFWYGLINMENTVDWIGYKKNNNNILTCD